MHGLFERMKDWTKNTVLLRNICDRIKFYSDFIQTTISSGIGKAKRFPSFGKTFATYYVNFSYENLRSNRT